MSKVIKYTLGIAAGLTASAFLGIFLVGLTQGAGLHVCTGDCDECAGHASSDESDMFEEQ